MAVGSYRVLVRDSGFNRVGEISTFEKLEMALRFNAPGTWRLEMAKAAPIDAQGNWQTLAGPIAGTPDTDVATLLSQPGAGIIVERNGVVLMSGPVRKLERVWSETQDNLVAWGPDDMAVLADRIVLPVPGGSAPYSGSAYDVRTGIAETIIRQYVDVNAGPSARSDRAVPGLTLAVDGGHGTTITGRGRFQQLLELVRQLAYDGGDLGFRVVQSGTTRQFAVYQPTDRTATVVFSRELDNLSGVEYSLSSAEANYVTVGGGGTGTGRSVQEGQDSASVVRWGRIETFLDRRDTTVVGELNQAITDELAARAQRSELKLSPIDTDAIAFMTDYQLGDKVTVVVDGVALADLVRQVNIVLTATDSEQVAPVVGGSNLAKVVPTFFGGSSTQRSLDVRVSNLERV